MSVAIKFDALISEEQFKELAKDDYGFEHRLALTMLGERPVCPPFRPGPLSHSWHLRPAICSGTSPACASLQGVGAVFAPAEKGSPDGGGAKSPPCGHPGGRHRRL